MDQNKKIIFLAIYWMIFLFSFYSAFQIRSELIGKREGMQLDLYMFGQEWKFESINNAKRLGYLFYTLSTVAIVVSVIMVYLIITYNYDVVQEKEDTQDEIKKIWEKQD